MELLKFGDSGWGDELFFATLMTLAVAVTAMLIGFLFGVDNACFHYIIDK